MSLRSFVLVLVLTALAGCHGSADHDCRDAGTCASSSTPDLADAQSCAGGSTTTLTGTVFAPNGTLPLYNAVVYVPTSPVEPFASTVSCERCDGALSGNPVAKTLTNADGTFTLTNVPAGTDVPLVVQLGHWRRQLKLPTVQARATTAVDPALTRLPRNASEGEIPQMAIATGQADPMECLLLKLGLDAAEIDAPGTSARVHLYQGTNKPGLLRSPPQPRASELYASLDELMKHDVVLLPCESDSYDKSKLDGKVLDPDPRGLLAQYVDAGGRLFATHYSYDWLTYPGSPFNKIANPMKGGFWPVKQADDVHHTITADLVTTFPKGAAFAEWLIAAGVGPQPSTLDINEGRHDMTAVDPAYAQSWIEHDFSAVGGGPGVMHFTFNTPLDAQPDATGQPAYCGRVVFSDFHVTAGSLKASMTTLPFPDACDPSPMTDQEKALAFMLFDLSSCVQDDSTAPIL